MKFSAEQRKGLEKYLNIFSSIMYTDDALRRFFKEYATRPEYANTIFFITGDHALPELNVSWRSPWERFRVPFIIWSPMLKEKKHFRSVISHNDITPSVLAMMRNTCGIETSRMAHWIGQGIDTVQDFRCARSVVFIRNSKEMVEFIDTGYCLTEGRLARVRPDLKGEPVNNDDLLAKMKAKLDNYIRVTDYVGKQNCLIPIGMMFGHEPVGTPIPVSEPVILDKTPTTQEYMSVVKSFPIGGEILYMHCDVAFTLRSPETDPAKIPMIAFEVTGPGDSKLGWDGLPLLAPGEYRPDEPVRVVFRRNIDLSYIHEPEKCSLKLYLWNREKISFTADSLSVVLTGYR